MAKTPVPVDAQKLRISINAVEANGPLSNRSALHEAVAAHYNATHKPEKPVTFSVVGLRIAEWHMDVKTVAGKRGRSAMTDEQKAAMAAGRGQRTTRAEKFEKNSLAMAGFKELRRKMRETSLDGSNGKTADRYESRVDAAEKGSARAAIMLNCIECANGQKFAKLCAITDCPLFAISCAYFNRPMDIIQKLVDDPNLQPDDPNLRVDDSDDDLEDVPDEVEEMAA